MRKYFGKIFFLCILGIFFCSCTGRAVSDNPTVDGESEDLSAGERLLDGYVWTARFEMAENDDILYRATTTGDAPQLMGSALYYKISSPWDKDRHISERAVYVQEQGEKARLLLRFGKEDRKFLSDFAVGEDGALYFVYGELDEEGEKEAVILMKLDKELRERYSVDVTQILTDLRLFDWEVRADGSIYGLTDDGMMLFWNERGEFQEQFSLNIDNLDTFNPGGLICTRSEGDYAYYLPQEENGSTKLLLYPLDVWREMGEQKRKTAQPLAVDLRSQSVAAQNYDQLFVFADREGAYLADKNGLYKINLTDGSLVKLFTWEEVNLRVESIQQMARQEDGSFLFYVLDSFRKKNAWCLVEAVPASEAPEKTELVLGVASIPYGCATSLSFFLNEVVLSYNLIHPECPVTIRQYNRADLTDFQLELINGEGPDLLLEPSTYFDMENLLQKNAVIDLMPYLEKSEEVTTEDIVPGILKAITKEGQIARIPLSFSVDVLIIPKEKAEERMTPEELFSFASKEALYRDIYPFSVWQILQGGEIEKYVDEEKQSCFFDREEFVDFLEDMRTLNNLECMGNTKMRAELFRDRQLPLIQDELSCMMDYLNMRDAFADCGRIIGYPNSDRELRYPLNMYDWLGINNASEHKEEAWSFIEFCLSYPFFTDKVSDRFTVVRDIFEEQICFDNVEKLQGAYPYPSPFTGKSPEWNNPVFTTEEETDWLREITEHLYFYENNDLENIVREESAAFFAGDISAQETAKRIQSRAMLVLGE